MSLGVLPFATTHRGGEGSSASVPIMAVVSGSVSSEDRRSSLSASIGSIWSWDMLFGWDDEEEELCFQIGFSIGVSSWDFASCIVLIPVNTPIIVKNLPDLCIDCWLFSSFCQKIFTGKIFHLLPIWLPEDVRAVTYILDRDRGCVIIHFSSSYIPRFRPNANKTLH